MSRKSCLNHPDRFFNVCGKFTPASQKKKLTKYVKVAYKHYFGCKIGDQDKAWAPHICCKTCYTGLTEWLNGKQKKHGISAGFCIQTALQHYVLSFICFKTFQFPLLLLFQSEIMIAAQQNQ